MGRVFFHLSVSRELANNEYCSLCVLMEPEQSTENNSSVYSRGDNKSKEGNRRNNLGERGASVLVSCCPNTVPDKGNLKKRRFLGVTV